MSKNIDTDVKALKSPLAKSAPNTAADPKQFANENITGRGVFVINTVSAGVAVHTAFLAEDGRLLDTPAVFPSLMYALAQIDELKQLVTQRFSDAAKIGNQVIAQQGEADRALVSSDAKTIAAGEAGKPVGVTSVVGDDT